MRGKILIGLLIVFLSNWSVNIYAKATNEQAIIQPVVGVSLPEQRTSRWVQDKRALQQYAEIQQIVLDFRFSDNDPVYQAYQIENLINSNINILIVVAEDVQVIRDVLELAHSRGILVVVYDTIITNTKAIDLFVTFDTSVYNRDLYDIDLEKLSLVASGKVRSMPYFDSRILAEATLYHAIKIFFKNYKSRNYAKINNNSKLVLSQILEPIDITQKNYRHLLIDSQIVDIEDLNLP